MPAINVLPKNIADLIAAGEVVERPSSVIKEFVENSIDAGSKKIIVEISCGGKSYMRVTDDGCGISRQDVKKAFLSHATSKIKSAEDLDMISTLGFRGEALASICAVSRVELLTKPSDSELGTRYVIEGGEEILLDDAGCPTGTTILVRDLFYNIPARMKFLKKDVQEGNYIASLLERIAISHPEISFKFIRDNKLQFTTPGNGDLLKTVYSVFGGEFTESLLPVLYEQNGVKVSGFVSKPLNAKNSRTLQIFYVNNRYVKIPLFVTALETAYKNSVMSGKFPPCVLFTEVPFSAVDVNVHPSKTEVRFFEEKKIFDAIYQATVTALQQDVKRPTVDVSKARFFINSTEKGEQLPLKSSFPQKTEFVSEPKKQTFVIKEYGNSVSNTDTVLLSPKNDEHAVLDFLEDEYLKPKETVKSYDISDNPEIEHNNTETTNTDVTAGVDEAAKETPEISDHGTQTVLEDIPEFTVIGEAFKTYIIAELNGKILLVDKHAAHERIIFNRLKENASFSAQLLLQPVIVNLSADEYDAVLENTDLLYEAGYDVSDFGNRSVKVSSCPVELIDEDISGLITEISEYLSVNIKTVIPEKLDWIYHSSACRAAVKAGNFTSKDEMHQLVEHLLKHNEIKCCPHGRPVAVEISKYELEKLFKRIV